MLRRFAAVFVIAVASVAVLSAGNRAAAQNWIMYAPSGVGYSIELPGQPKVSVNDVGTDAGTAKLTQAIFESGDTAYVASHIDYAPSIIASRSIDGHLDAARDGQVKGGRLVSEDRIVVSGHRARHVVIAKQRYVVVVRSTLVGRRLFQIVYVGRPGTETGPGAQRFLNSFKIVRR